MFKPRIARQLSTSIGRSSRVARFHVNPYRQVSDAKGVWSINESNLRLRRADDDFEKVFTPYGRNLDTASITNFHSWNLLNGAEYKDFLYDVPLGVDSNDDGVSDGWSTFDFSGSVGDYRCEEGSQIAEITSNPSNGDIAVNKVITGFVEGDAVSLCVDGKTDGTISAYLIVRFLDAGDSTLAQSTSSDFNGTNFEKITVLNAVAPVNTAKINVLLRVKGNTGLTGTAYFKNAVLVKNSFTEDIGLLTQDDDSDGVANEWTYSESSGGTGTPTIDGGQKLSLETSTGGSSRVRVVRSTLPIVAGDTFDISLDAKLVTPNDAYAQVNILYNGAGTTSNISINATSEFQTFTDTKTAPALTTSVDVFLQIFATNSGDTGEVTYRNVTLKQTNNSVYVTEIQDATGNGNHATQDTASEQPRLVNAGVFEVDSDGNYSPYYDGIDDHFDVTDNAGLDITSGGLSILAEYDSANNNNVAYIISRNLDNASTVQYGYVTNDDNAAKDDLWLNGVGRLEMVEDNKSNISIYTWDGSNIKAYKDSIFKNTAAYSTPLISRPNVQIGCRSASVDGLTKIVFYEGHMSEIAIFDKALTQSQVTTLTNRL